MAVSRRHTDFKFAVLFIDIDEFKVVNDSLGHAAGDALLIQIAQRLTACLREADTISSPRLDRSVASLSCRDSTLARPGGDEFAVLMEELHDPSDAVRVAERLQKRLAVPFNLDGHEIVTMASVGIAFSSNAAQKPKMCSAMPRSPCIARSTLAKPNARCSTAACMSDALKRLQLEADLRKAMELGEFRVYYQPIVSLRNNQIVGFETLSRWQRPEGIVMPGEFIAVADEIGIILPINRQLLQEACHQLHAWHELFPSDPPLTIAVNITPKQFAQPDLASEIGQILQANRDGSSLSRPGNNRDHRYGRRRPFRGRARRVESPWRSS